MNEFLEFGGKLKQVREARGISLEDVQAATKIPIDILRSIEHEETIRKLSPIYHQGFLKIYAKFLGVEFPQEKKVYTAYPSLISDKKTGVLKEIKFPSVANINLLLWFKVAAGLIAIIALIYFIPRLTHKKKVLLTANNKVSSVAVSKPTREFQPSKTGQIKLSVRAKENTWLNVKRDGKTVFRQILRKGSVDSWVAKEKFELSIANATAIELEVNNKIIPSLGKKGQALRNVIITKDGLSVED